MSDDITLDTCRALLAAGSRDEWWPLDASGGIDHLTPDQHDFYEASPSLVSWLITECERLSKFVREMEMYGSVDSVKELNAAVERLTAERDAARRDVTALRSELASIAIMLQERKRLPDLGGSNFALVASAVLVYVLELEEARDAFVSMMDDGLNTAITEMARWDSEAKDAEIERLTAENTALRTAAAEHAMNENYTLEGQRVLQEMAAENRKQS